MDLNKAEIWIKVANLTRDFDILKRANEDAKDILRDIDKYDDLKKILKDSINKD